MLSATSRQQWDSIYVEVGPDTGDPVILIHGFTDSLRTWDPAMSALHRLDPKLHVFAIDIRGHGASSMPNSATCAPAPEKCFRRIDLVQDVLAFMRAKNIDRATLAGHSLGSMVVQELALTHPQRVTRAILVGTTLKLGDPAAFAGFVHDPIEAQWSKKLIAQGKRFPQDFYEVSPFEAEPESNCEELDSGPDAERRDSRPLAAGNGAREDRHVDRRHACPGCI